MVIILPNKVDGLAALTDKLEEVNAECSSRLAQTYAREVRVYLPRFRTETKLDLKDTLSNKVRRNVPSIIDNKINATSYLICDLTYCRWVLLSHSAIELTLTAFRRYL